MDFTILVIPYMVGRGEKVSLAGSDTQRFRVLMERLREQMQFASHENCDKALCGALANFANGAECSQPAFILG